VGQVSLTIDSSGVAITSSPVGAAGVLEGRIVAGPTNMIKQTTPFADCPAGGHGDYGLIETKGAGDVPVSLELVAAATRYYDADGNLTRPVRTFDFDGAHLSNPLTGAVLSYHQRNIDWHVLAVPGDLSTATTSGHGELSVTAPGYGQVLHGGGIAVTGPDGSLLHMGGRDDLSSSSEHAGGHLSPARFSPRSQRTTASHRMRPKRGQIAATWSRPCTARQRIGDEEPSFG
jgi:hypothetical protein